MHGRALRSGERYPAVVVTTASFAVGLLLLLPLAAGETLLGTTELDLLLETSRPTKTKAMK